MKIKIRFILFACLCAFALTTPIQAEDYKFEGKHYLASFYGCDEKALNDFEALKEVMVKAAEASHATVLDKAAYPFEPAGMTMVLLLSESHASIHTYPEHNACFIDLFTCGDTCTYEGFEDVLIDYLKPKTLNRMTFNRD